MSAEAFPRIHQMGETGILVEFGSQLSMQDNAAAIAFRAAVGDADWPGIRETACSLKSVYIGFDPAHIAHPALVEKIKDLLNAAPHTHGSALPAHKIWRIPTLFGGSSGPGLPEVATQTGLSETDLVAQIAATPMRVLTLGFAPGMPYLGQLPDVFDIPRRTVLTPKVPAGALGLAIRQIVVFPKPSQTGWQWIGRAAIDLFDPNSHDPFPLSAGDEVFFEPVDATTFERARAHPMALMPEVAS